VIAWISHHFTAFNGQVAGGAEMTDATLLEDAPVKVDTFLPADWKQAMDYDQIIITGTDLLTPYAMTRLAQKSPIVAIHHEQTQNEHRGTLLSSAKLLMCRTPRHIELELKWTSPKATTWVLSPHDLSEFTIKAKERFALWAARMHWQKGPEEAKAWAAQTGIPLVMMSQKPRPEVLETMSRAEHFVFLPNAFDAEPRAVVEAVLSGCKVHTNDFAGITSVPGWDNPEVIGPLVSNAKQLFWDRILL
jgi:hypothetical protein